MISVSLLSTMVFLFAANKYNHCSSEYPASEPHFSKNELIFRAQEGITSRSSIQSHKNHHKHKILML